MLARGAPTMANSDATKAPLRTIRTAVMTTSMRSSSIVRLRLVPVGRPGEHRDDRVVRDALDLDIDAVDHGALAGLRQVAELLRDAPADRLRVSLPAHAEPWLRVIEVHLAREPDAS